LHIKLSGEKIRKTIVILIACRHSNLPIPVAPIWGAGLIKAKSYYGVSKAYPDETAKRKWIEKVDKAKKFLADLGNQKDGKLLTTKQAANLKKKEDDARKTIAKDKKISEAGAEVKTQKNTDKRIQMILTLQSVIIHYFVNFHL
jgi:hypothetical protein